MTDLFHQSRIPAILCDTLLSKLLIGEVTISVIGRPGALPSANN